MKEINVEELRKWQKEGREFLLVDVREEWEHSHSNIGGMLLPLGELMHRKEEIPQNIPVVLYCEKGIRSVIASQRLEPIGFQNLYNLKGGMKAWRKD
ncbi:MAG: rhodanese-like domain-containing protein [Chitinophagaceae bacterium]